MKKEKKRIAEATGISKTIEKEYWCNVHQTLCEDVRMDLADSDYCNMDCNSCCECEDIFN